VTTSHQCEIAFVVVFNLTRFARDKYDHFALRSAPDFHRSGMP
jgi:hypothetical protein